jgi:hypothetical protein
MSMEDERDSLPDPLNDGDAETILLAFGIIRKRKDLGMEFDEIDAVTTKIRQILTMAEFAKLVLAWLIGVDWDGMQIVFKAFDGPEMGLMADCRKAVLSGIRAGM